jgi:nitrate/nitrite transporter NarK
LRYIPFIRPAGGQKFDLLGALTLFASLLCLLSSLTFGRRVKFTDTPILVAFAMGLLLLVLFCFIELRSKQPMIDLRLFRNVLFSVNLVTGFITFVSIAGTIFLMPFYLQNILGYSPLQAGLLMAVVTVAMALTAPLSGDLSDRFGTRPITVIGLAVLLIGYILVSTLDLSTSGVGYVLRFLGIGLGMGIFQSPNNSAIMGAALRERLGSSRAC